MDLADRMKLYENIGAGHRLIPRRGRVIGSLLSKGSVARERLRWQHQQFL
jgi:hypothetical protein